ncbi:MAG TPA: DrmE family protein [Selenomonadales bacterium]|nr:DrmE family protein [Selenomonadales bacterium]
MSQEKNLYEIIQKCDICLNGEVVSRELLLQAYAKFISETICSGEHQIGISLHTDSICFDLITIIYAALGCLLYDQTTPEDVVNSLQSGDLIIYNEQTRAVFIGKNDNGFACIKQEVVSRGQKSFLTSTIAPQNFYKIKPYKGESTMLDGRGIRKDTRKRFNFIESVFGICKANVSGTTRKSVIVISSREIADMIVRGTVIFYEDGKSVQLTELVTASYYTENDEYGYSGNPGKTEPVLKFMSNISLAREHIIEDEHKQIIGLLVLGKQIVDNGKSELIGLMGRNSLKYVFVCYALECDDNKGFLETYPELNLFACTKEFLLSFTVPSINRNGLIGDLNTRIDNIIDKDIEITKINSEIDWDTYKNIKKDVHFIKNNQYSDDNIEYFIIHSFSLLNLFSTAVFPIITVEKAVTYGKVGCFSPHEQMSKLEEIAEAFTGTLGDKMKSVLTNLQKMQTEVLYRNSKYEFIKNKLANMPIENRILLVVPKAFYNTILSTQLENDGYNRSQLYIDTTSKFDSEKLYDEIIIISAFKKRFNLFANSASSKMLCLLYPYEIVLYNSEYRKYKEMEQFYNKYSYFGLDLDEVLQQKEKVENLHEEAKINEIDIELNKYIEEISIKAALSSISNTGSASTTALMADIIRIAILQDGETVFFSKYYTPYILDQNQSIVSETNVKYLNPGDMLIFTKYTEQTKDIVDEIICKMISSEYAGADIADIKEAFRKSKHWKSVLKKYMLNNGLTFKDISTKMSDYGTAKHETTLRSWLNEESHIVGPREQDAFYQIALICEDEEMLIDPDSFCRACDIIRSTRMQVLKLIGISVIRSIQGIQDETNELLSIVQEKVGELSQVVQIESISDVSGVKVPAHLANRPYRYK